MRALVAFCEQERDWLLETIEALVRIESPSTDKAAVDRCGRELERRLASIGGRVTRLPRADAGDHLLAEFGCGDAQVLLLGHFDTVWPCGHLAGMPVRIDNGRLYGPGVFDMKAGIALAMLAVRALAALGGGSRRVVMLWTSDEEIGSRSSREAIEDEARRSQAVLVLEPPLPGGALKTERKGCGDFELTVHGVSAHAGIDPWRGASAIHELARQILALDELQDPERGISINVGLMSGGRRLNVVADHATARVDVRVRTREDAARMEAALRGLQPTRPEIRLEMRGGFERPSLERSPEVVRLFKMAQALAGELGRPLEEGGTGGGSDGSFTAALGAPTLDGLGAVGNGAHAVDEHVMIDELPWRAALVAGLIARIG